MFPTCYGPEFIAQAVRDWISAVGAKTAYIEPGSPWENGYCESFNARFRDEMLNGEVFYSTLSSFLAVAVKAAFTGFPASWSFCLNDRNIAVCRDACSAAR